MIRHLAAIMDGNRRWAQKNKLALITGYSQGGKRALQDIISFCIERSIPYLSLYVFSLENFYRSEEEKSLLFSVLLKEIQAQQAELIKESISVTFVGKLNLLPQEVLQACKDVEKETAQGSRLKIALLICYGGQQEIINAVHKVVLNKSISNTSSYEDIKQEFEKSLWNNSFPSPDLIIRTGGMKRLSNFLLYQSAYSELVFLDVLWPDMTKQHCQEAYDMFQATKRNFGR